MSEADIVMELKDQGVDEVSRFILKKDDKEIKTNTLFVTFCAHTPPPKLKIGYYNVYVKLHIPNPLRCFDCQEFDHSRKYCKNNSNVENVVRKDTMEASASQRLSAALTLKVIIALPL